MKPEHEQYILEHMDKKPAEEIAKDLGLKERKVRKFLERQKDNKTKPDQTAIPVNKRFIFVSIALIVIFGFCAFGNSIKGDFLFDDETLVTENRFIRDWGYLPDVFKEDLGAGAGKEWNAYRPFQVVTYMADHSIWELDPRGYHLTNVILHVLTALCLFWFLNILFNDHAVSLITSLFFVVHPIHTQAVSYIAGRADSLAAIFMLVTFILYLKQGGQKNIGLYILMLLSCTLAILSRENGLFLPVFILVYHYAFKKGIYWKEYISLAGIVVGYLILRSVFFTHLMPATTLHRTTFLERMPGFFVALAKYAQLLAWPVGLHMEYGEKVFKISNPIAIAGAAVLLLLVILIIRSRQKDRLVHFAALWFMVTLLPTSNIYPINAYMAEHWLYLPSIGIFLLVAKGMSALYGKPRFRAAVFIVSGGLLCFYSFLTFLQNAVYWREPIAFYQRTIHYAPDSFSAHNNLGKLYQKMGKTKEAKALFQKAIEINPRTANAYNNLAAVSHEPGVNDEYIIKLLRSAVKYDPFHAKARYNLGKLFSDIGQREKAIPEFEKAIKLDPNYIEAYDKLGIVYGQTGRWDEAIAVFKRAVDIQPDYAVAQTNLSIAYFHNGQVDLAVKHCKKALKLGFEVPPEFLKTIQPHMSP